MALVPTRPRTGAAPKRTRTPRRLDPLLMGEQTIGLITAGILSVSGLVILALGSERRRRRRLRKRLSVAGSMLFVSGLLVFAASLALLPPDGSVPVETVLPPTEPDSGLWPRYY